MSHENSSLRALAILNERRARSAEADTSSESPAPASISELQDTTPKTDIVVLAINYILVSEEPVQFATEYPCEFYGPEYPDAFHLRKKAENYYQLMEITGRTQPTNREEWKDLLTEFALYVQRSEGR